MAAGKKKRKWTDVYAKSDRLTKDSMLVGVYRDLVADKYPHMTYGIMQGLIAMKLETRSSIENRVLKAMKGKDYINKKGEEE